MHFIKTESGQVTNIEAVARFYVTQAVKSDQNRGITKLVAELVNGHDAVLATFLPLDEASGGQDRAIADAQLVLNALTHNLRLNEHLIDMRELRGTTLKAGALKVA